MRGSWKKFLKNENQAGKILDRLKRLEKRTNRHKKRRVSVCKRGKEGHTRGRGTAWGTTVIKQK